MTISRQSSLESAAQAIIEQAKSLEPCDVEVCIQRVNESSITYENDDFTLATSNETTVAGVRAIVGGRMGFITTNVLDEVSLRDSAREVQQIARYSPQSPHYRIAQKNAGAAASAFEAEEMVDSKLVSLQPKDMMGLMDLMVGEVFKDKRALLEKAKVSVDDTTFMVLNSHGVSRRLRQVLFNWSLFGAAKDSSEVTSFDYDGDGICSHTDLEKRVLKTAGDFRNSVVGSLGTRAGRSYRGPVLLHPAAVESLIEECVSFNGNGRAQQDGMSPWKDQLGQTVASSLLTIWEKPTDRMRPLTYSPFDREGLLTCDRAVVKAGKLSHVAHNLFSATRGKVDPTGNAVGGARGVPSIGFRALTVQEGSATEAELLQGLGTGLILKRFSGNANPTSGHFSGVAKNSWWVENGQRSHPLKEVMVSGNLFDVLKNVRLVGAQSYQQMGNFQSPYILVDGISVTAAN
jgi:PmbA protein